MEPNYKSAVSLKTPLQQFFRDTNKLKLNWCKI